MIHITHLTKQFGSIHAVDGVSFEVARGEVVGLLGPNGAGKTTTMRIITGFLTATSGTVTVDGFDVRTHAQEAQQRIGYLPENAPLYTDMEVTEYLEYTAKLRNMSQTDYERSLAEMIETCGLQKVVGRPIGELSKGYRQRVGLAATMLHKPAILILDEPTSGLDPNQISEIRTLIREIGRERTVILSTHILQEVEATCSRALIISNGKLVGSGTIAELLGRSTNRARYTISVRASRETLSEKLASLPKCSVISWLSDPLDERQRVTLTNGGGEDRSEDIFRWAVDHHLTLAELSHETASLEDVFRELTS